MSENYLSSFLIGEIDAKNVEVYYNRNSTGPSFSRASSNYVTSIGTER